MGILMRSISFFATKEDCICPGPPKTLPGFDLPIRAIITSNTPAQESIPVSTPPPGKCCITTLPTELIQQISSNLIVESLVCFSLTCKSILNTIGNQSWKNSCIAGRGEYDSVRERWFHDLVNIIHRANLLRFLARDLEDWSYCSTCVILHPRLPRPRDMKPRMSVRECSKITETIDYFPKATAPEKGGYTLAFEHILEALGPIQDTYHKGDIEMMSGSYSVLKKSFVLPPATIKHALKFSARRVEEQLVFKHEHRFSLESRTAKRRLWAQDILSVPLRICPHHTTSLNILKTIRNCPHHMTGYKSYKKMDVYHTGWRGSSTHRYNGPMLTHAITSAFPTHKRIASSYRNWLWFLRPKFRTPTITEENQMKADRRQEDFWWCRSCPTKFKVQYEKEGQELVVSVWHCLGSNEDIAKTHWRALVRGNGGETNTEFASQSREFPWFSCG